MTYRTDLPRIKPDKEPSLVNEDMFASAALGGALGGLFQLVLGGKNRATQIFVYAAFILTGGILGGLSGKAKQEREQVQGRIVEHPGFFNQGIVSGAILADSATDIVDIIKDNNSKTTSWSVRGIIAFLGATIGSIVTQQVRQKDFNKAVAIRDKQQQALQARIEELSRHHGYDGKITKDDMRLLVGHPQHGSQYSHVEKLTEQKEHAEQAPTQTTVR